MSKANHLETVGEALFGSRWQTDLADALGVSDRTMRRWKADPSEIPETVWDDCRKLLSDRATHVAKVLTKLPVAKVAAA